MNCEDVRNHLLDHLDGLLDEPDARGVDAHLETCPACAAHARRAGSVREALYRPYGASEPPADLPARIRRRARPPRRRWAYALVRYAASFAAGVLVTLWLTAPSTSTAPASSAESPPAVEDRPPVTQIVVPPFPRRIR